MPKRKLRFNFIDLLLLLLAAAAILVLVVALVGGKPKDENTTRIEYVVEIQNVDKAFEAAIENDQPVQDAVSRKVIGTVAGVDPIDFKMITFNYDDKDVVLSDVEGRKTLLVTIAANAEKARDAYMVNGVVIRVGKQYSLVFPTMYGVGYCTSLKDMSESTSEKAPEE